MQIEMHEDTLALIAVDGIGRHDVKVAGTQFHRRRRKVQPRLTLGDEIDAGEGRVDLLPVPVAVVTGLSYVQHLKIQAFYREMHRSVCFLPQR